MSKNSNPSVTDSHPFRSRLISWPLLLIGLTILAVLAANTVSAWNRPAPRDLESVKSHVAHFVDHALDRLDATGEQQASIRRIVMATIDDLAAARGDSESAYEPFRDWLVADTIDRDTLEAFRAEQLDRADEMSRIALDGLAGVMEILTPEQRRILEERLAEHRGRHHRGGWGWH